MKILFWNLKGNDILEYIKECVLEYDIDIAVFSEYTSVDFESLECKLEKEYRYIPNMGGCKKVALFVKSSIEVAVKREQARYALYSVEYNNKNYILAAIHLQDRWTTDTQVRIMTIGRLVNDIKNLEESEHCKNTIIIGDFNANPFDDELLQVNAFNAVLYKDIINSSETKKVGEERFRRFYNPIIHFLSEDTKMYGSHYNTNKSNSPIWHCLDQVLVSKKLVESVNELKYIRNIGSKSLLNRKKPNASISDHLPLYVQIT